MKDQRHFDVIIIGGSYSGLSAGMALGRALRQVLIIDSGKPCNSQSPNSHNFITHDGKTPKEIATLARQQVERYGTAECWGISVLHCPYCHGYEIRNKRTGILGNGEHDFEISMLISNRTKDLTLFTNGKSVLTAGQKVKLNGHGIKVIEAMQKTSIHGVYACGDNSTRIRTLAIAVATGTTAGMMVNKEIVFEEFYKSLL